MFTDSSTYHVIDAEGIEANRPVMVYLLDNDTISLMELVGFAGFDATYGEDQWSRIVQVEVGDTCNIPVFIGDAPSDPNFIEAYYPGANCMWWHDNPQHDHWLGSKTQAICEHMVSLNHDDCIHCCVMLAEDHLY